MLRIYLFPQVLSKFPDLAHILIVKGVLKAMSIRIDLNTESALCM